MLTRAGAPFRPRGRSQYYSMMTITSIGYGDVAASTLSASRTSEQIVACLLMLVGSMVMAQVIATFCGVISTMDIDGAEFAQRMDELNRLMAKEMVPSELQVRPAACACIPSRLAGASVDACPYDDGRTPWLFSMVPFPRLLDGVRGRCGCASTYPNPDPNPNVAGAAARVLPPHEAPARGGAAAQAAVHALADAAGADRAAHQLALAQPRLVLPGRRARVHDAG